MVKAVDILCRRKAEILRRKGMSYKKTAEKSLFLKAL